MLSPGTIHKTFMNISGGIRVPGRTQAVKWQQVDRSTTSLDTVERARELLVGKDLCYRPGPYLEGGLLG